MKAKSAAPSSAAGYEKRDANTRSLTIFAAAMFVTLVLVLFLMAKVFHHFAASQSLGPPASPFANARVLPPQPRLQVEPRLDLQQLRVSEEEALTSYGWVDQKAGIVRIPIDRAMELLLEKGLPVRQDSGAKPQDKK